MGVCKPVMGRPPGPGQRLAPGETAEPLAGPFRLPQRRPRPRRARRSWAGRGLLFLAAERSPRAAGEGASRRHILSRRRPRGAATMSTAAFHISSLLEKMTSSDKDFRCVLLLGPRLSALLRNPPPSLPQAPARPQDSAAPASSPRVRLSSPRFSQAPPPRLGVPGPWPAHGRPALSVTPLQLRLPPCKLQPLPPVPHQSRSSPLCTLPQPLRSSVVPSPHLSPQWMGPGPSPQPALEPSACPRGSQRLLPLLRIETPYLPGTSAPRADFVIVPSALLSFPQNHPRPPPCTSHSLPSLVCSEPLEGGGWAGWLCRPR